jgi:GT2 family glycosyltransferase
MTPDVAVVVIHHRGRDQLLECLEALARATRGGRRMEVILVDNASREGVAAEVRHRYPAFRIVHSPRNVGFTGGIRLGVDAASARHVAFINDDAVVDPDWLVCLAAAIETAPIDVAAVGGRLTDRSGTRNDFSDGFVTFDGHAFQMDPGKPLDQVKLGAPGEERLFACGGNMIVRREVFLESGGFDDDYFAYLEDVDFGWRQWIEGRRVLFEPRATARHRGGATGEALGIYRRGYLFEKNAFMTAYKNLGGEAWQDLAPPILAAFANRVARMLTERNPGCAILREDPYLQEPAPRSFGRRLGWLGRRREPAERAVVDDPLAIAHLRAMLWIFEHADRLAAKRRAVQSRRKRSDSEIFERFPLWRVPTYVGDDRFDGDFFATLWPQFPPLRRTTLAEIFGDRR